VQEAITTTMFVRRPCFYLRIFYGAL